MDYPVASLIIFFHLFKQENLSGQLIIMGQMLLLSFNCVKAAKRMDGTHQLQPEKSPNGHIFYFSWTRQKGCHCTFTAILLHSLRLLFKCDCGLHATCKVYTHTNCMAVFRLTGQVTINIWQDLTRALSRQTLEKICQSKTNDTVSFAHCQKPWDEREKINMKNPHSTM